MFGGTGARVRRLFPEGRLRVRRLTLAPPLARAITQLHPALYTAFNACPLSVRTKRLGRKARIATADPVSAELAIRSSNPAAGQEVIDFSRILRLPAGAADTAGSVDCT